MNEKPVDAAQRINSALSQHGKHGFTTTCLDGNWLTFSVGVFQWVLKANGKDVKKGAAKVRVKGFATDSAAVFAKADAIAKELDAGTYRGVKYVDLTKEVFKCD